MELYHITDTKFKWLTDLDHVTFMDSWSFYGVTEVP